MENEKSVRSCELQRSCDRESRLAELQRETDELKSKLLLAEKEINLVKEEKESTEERLKSMIDENRVRFDSLRRNLEEKDLLIEEEKFRFEEK